MDYSVFHGTMADMNWKEIEEMGKAKAPVLFPLGVIEEHGPHLPLGTDIYYSYAVCRMIQAALNQRKADCLIAPPYYWGINHCTGAFPGSFSVQPETFRMILNDIFANLHQFGFDQIYCVNYHGDALHVATILESIQSANEKYEMSIKLLLEPHDLQLYQLTGQENYILVDEAEYPNELFAMFEPEEGENPFDIHAGAFETAAMKTFYPNMIEGDFAKTLPSYSLTEEDLYQWLEGGENVKNVVPLGYAGSPAVFEKKLEGVKTMFQYLADYYAGKILELQKSR